MAHVSILATVVWAWWNEWQLTIQRNWSLHCNLIWHRTSWIFANWLSISYCFYKKCSSVHACVRVYAQTFIDQYPSIAISIIIQTHSIAPSCIVFEGACVTTKAISILHILSKAFTFTFESQHCPHRTVCRIFVMKHM